MKFLTDITTNASHLCLLHIKKLNDKRRINKSLFFIDPGVTQLFKNAEYEDIEKLHSIVGDMKENEYISIDYPPAFNLTNEHLFFSKTIENNIRYADNDHYICTIHGLPNDSKMFIKAAERLRYIWERPGKIVAIGMGGIKIGAFTDNVYGWIAKNMRGKWVHVYGMPMRHIKKYAKMLEAAGILLSADSTKWTKRIHDRPPLDKKVCCTNATRDTFFLEYMKEIKRSGIPIEF